MLLDSLSTNPDAADPHVLFFGGKGGVGKSTVAAATAVDLAEHGHRTLLVSTDPAHNLGHMWNRPIGNTPTKVADNLELLELDPEHTTDEHLAGVGDTMRRMMPERLHGEVTKHLDLARNSPGTHEAAMIEAMATVIEDSAHDYIVFDTAPSGHTSRLLALPELMNAWTQGLLDRRAKSERFSELVRGMSPETSARDAVDRRNQELRSILHQRQRRFAHLREVLTTQSVFFLVLNAEKVAVLETAELYEDLNSTGITIGGCVVNRRSPGDQGEFLAKRRALEDVALADLTETLSDVPITEVPLLDSEVSDPEVLREVATYL